MRIINLKADNFKKLEAIDITPDDFNVISGKNGAGKSSVLDAIITALAGVDSKSTPEPIKKGTSKALVKLDLGEIKIERHITPSGQRLVVTNNGTPVNSPQTILDKLYNKVAFDPARFLQLSEAEQVKILLKAAGVEQTLNDYQDKIKRAYDERTIQNRDAKVLAGQLAAYKDRTYPSDNELDAGELLNKIAKANQVNQTRAGYLAQMETIKAKAQAVASEKERLQKRLAEIEEEITQIKSDYTNVKAQIDQTPEADVTDLQNKLSNITSHNNLIRERKQFEQIKAKYDQAQAASKELTAEIEMYEEKKRTLLSDGSLPLKGLGLTDAGVTFNNIPLKQCSSAEQLKISLAISMALQPELKVILIKEGSLFDDNNLKLIYNFATKNGYQVWCEKVDSSGSIGIVIEEGKVVKTEAPVWQ